MPRNEEKNIHRFCSACGSPKMKRWDELSADEKFMVERLPLSGELTPAERKIYRYCARCFHGERNAESESA